MNDQEFLAQLKACTLPESEFHHVAHVRAGYLWLRVLPFFEATAAMRVTLQRYAQSLGKADRYHETVTIAFMALICARLDEAGDPGSWNAFARAHPDLLRKDALLAFYSPGTLASPRARRCFLLPPARTTAECSGAPP
jgi:hypothetical protein